MPVHSKLYIMSSASCHHAEHISCKITESLKFQIVVLPFLENVDTPLYRKLSVALNIPLMSLFLLNGFAIRNFNAHLLKC